MVDKELLISEAKRAALGECETPGCYQPATHWWKGDPIEVSKHCLKHYNLIRGDKNETQCSC